MVQRDDIAAPTGQRFTEMLPVPNVDNVLALTDRQEPHVCGSANPNVPTGPTVPGPVTSTWPSQSSES